MFGDGTIPHAQSQDASNNYQHDNWMQMFMDYLRRQQQQSQNKPMPIQPTIGQPMQNYTGQPIGVQPQKPQGGQNQAPQGNMLPNWNQSSSMGGSVPSAPLGQGNPHHLQVKGGIWQ